MKLLVLVNPAGLEVVVVVLPVAMVVLVLFRVVAEPEGPLLWSGLWPGLAGDWNL